jgi:hypothetical protein
VYRHGDGYPDVAGVDLRRFFEAVEEDTADTRFSDPSYLAAKYVVWLADKMKTGSDRFREEYGSGDAPAKNGKLNFLSVGVCLEDPGDIEYRYTVRCDQLDDNGRPEIYYQEVGSEERHEVPPIPQEDPAAA